MKALKEWATITGALQDGVQTVLLRKGGILETASGFRVESEKFLLYPTYEHQEPEHIRPEHHRYIAEAQGQMPKDGHVLICSYAELAGQADIDSQEKLDALAGYHIWTDSYVQSRVNWMPDKPLKAMLLRVYRIPEIKVRVLPEYGGCKSWIEINEDIGAGDPVLNDDDFAARLSEFGGITN